ncbi:hypothetical protein QNI19_12035 [Cytophagaceae bacterium DM2B3-1]|uniref:Uncharacterized protein n=1 Tax=Xanthocytophaga flava TaxID=3048013 RepID=A0ABT7CIW4_9BACT|nr:hypothetical protein [Xanthocytophaga flavus]MDJ1471867.1 hypothetical protein [Xanthocytophaga flavus]MDJ1493665.1 hypothetical protein [Xanthocytophaga flavus]
MTTEEQSLSADNAEPTSSTHPLWWVHAIAFSLLIAFFPRVNSILALLLFLVIFIPGGIGFINLIKSFLLSPYRRVLPIVGCQAIIVGVFFPLIRYANLSPVSYLFTVQESGPINYRGTVMAEYTYVYSIYTLESWAYFIYAIGSFLIWLYILQKYKQSYFGHMLFIHYFFACFAFVAIMLGPMDRAVDVSANW